jgi:hypothetical protein
MVWPRARRVIGIQPLETDGVGHDSALNLEMVMPQIRTESKLKQQNGHSLCLNTLLLHLNARYQRLRTSTVTCCRSFISLWRWRDKTERTNRIPEPVR